MIVEKKYKEFLGEKMKSISKEKIILDLGGGKRFQKWLKEYEGLFDDTQYKTMDLDESTNPDVVGDIHNIPLRDESVDAIICSSVLEHVNDPIRAVQEMCRILRKNGKALIFVPSIYPYHARKDHYLDMWRFFDDSILFMCKGFSSVEMCKFGGYFKAMSFFMPMQHKFQWALSPLSAFLDSLLKTNERHTTAGYYVYVVK